MPAKQKRRDTIQDTGQAPCQAVCQLYDGRPSSTRQRGLPGDATARPNNIREMHFSRNPKIALYMRNHKLVKEFGEGVDRMFREMEEAGQPAPEYRQNEFMVYATIRQHRDAVTTEKTTDSDDSVNDSVNDSLSDSVNKTYLTIKANPGIQRKRISELTGKSIPTIDRHIALLAKACLIEHRDSDKTGGYYPVTKK